MRFVGILLDYEVFLGLRFLISLTTKGFVTLLEIEVRLLYLISMIFDARNTGMMFKVFND